MKKLISLLFLLISLNVIAAEQECAPPDQKTALFFGNGINTSQFSAQTSLELLRRNIGDSYNDQTIRYDLAYNKTDGMAIDLMQSVFQQGIEFNSQIMGWLNNIGVAPAWFSEWYKRFLLKESTVVASELDNHVERYNSALLLGQTVIIVSHSQGNFYANEAKKLLEMKANADQMKGFAIFGVATPANNVGGKSTPYLTNNRDIILNVPGRLPANWTLSKTDSTSTDNLPQLEAHFFNNTYISSAYNIKPALISGIKSIINSLQQPKPVCDNYRKHLIGYFKGQYTMHEDPQTYDVGADGIITAPFRTTKNYTSSEFTIEASPLYLAIKRYNVLVEEADWDKNYKLHSFFSICAGDRPIPGTFYCVLPEIENAVLLTNKELTKWSMLPAQGLRNYMFCDSELGEIPYEGVGRSGNANRVPVSVNGTTLMVNKTSFDLAKGVSGEGAKVENQFPNLQSKLDNDPTMYIYTSYDGSGPYDYIEYHYSLMRGSKFLMIMKGGVKTLFCKVDRI